MKTKVPQVLNIALKITTFLLYVVLAVFVIGCALVGVVLAPFFLSLLVTLWAIDLLKERTPK